MGASFTKDPSAVLDYQFDWAAWLVNDTITGTPVITITPTGLTKDSQTNTTAAVTVWLSGGTVGKTYTVTCRIVTAGGRTDERSITIVCAQR